jgi:hypothetical protein
VVAAQVVADDLNRTAAPRKLAHSLVNGFALAHTGLATEDNANRFILGFRVREKPQFDLFSKSKKTKARVAVIGPAEVDAPT